MSRYLQNGGFLFPARRPARIKRDVVRRLAFVASGGLLLGMFLLHVPCQGQHWTRFRGENGAGVSDAASVPASWRAEDYNWVADLPGAGHSSPVIWGDSLFVTSGDEAAGKCIVMCWDVNTGRCRWEREFPLAPQRKHKLNSLASTTPAVDAQRLYVNWGTPDNVVLMALDHDGKDVWRVELEPFKSGHGYGISPIVFQQLLVLPHENQGSSCLLGLDCRTGEIRWRVDRESQLHYSTPCVFRQADRRAELIFTNWEQGITSLDPQTGKVNWQVDVFDKGHIESSIASPVVAGDLIIGTCGWLGYGNQVVAVRPSRHDPRIAAAEVWRMERATPLCSTPVVKDDLIFVWADHGIVTCAAVATGKIHWQQRVGGTFYSSPISVGDHIYNVSADGEVVVLAASREFQLAARTPLGEPTNATPAVANGTLFLRTISRLFSVGGKSK